MKRNPHLQNSYVRYVASLSDTSAAEELASAILHAAKLAANNRTPRMLDADEVASQVAAAMWRRLSTGKLPAERVIHLLQAITRNKVHDQWRRHFRLREAALSSDVVGVERASGRANALLSMPEPHASTARALYSTENVVEAAAHLGVTRRVMQNRVRRLRQAAASLEVRNDG